VAIGQQAEAADTHKTSRQNMQQEAAEEFMGIERHGASPLPVGIISPQEGNLTVGHSHESGVGNGNPMRIRRENQL
jgi:hypothetical protein